MTPRIPSTEQLFAQKGRFASMAFVSLLSEGHDSRALCLLLTLFAVSPGGAVASSSPPPEEPEAAPDDPLLDDFPVETDPSYETEVRGYRILRTDETTGFAETIDVSDSTETVSSVSEVLSEAAGVQVRRLGGLGAFGAASIRGSTPNQVPVLLDGVELSLGGSAAVDLGDFALDLFDRIEIYRGSAPLSLGASGIGGAIALETRRPEENLSAAALSYGSWTTGRILVLESARIGAVSTLAVLSASGSKGDFEYLNRNGTLRDETDDRMARRRNNRHQSLGVLVKLDAPLGGWRLTLANDLYAKDRGVPGIESVQTERAALMRLRDTVTAKLERKIRDRGTLRVDAAYGGLQEELSDPLLEFNQGSELLRSSTHTVSGALLGTLDWNSRHRTFARLGHRFERFSHEERRAGLDQASSPMRRLRTAFGAEHLWRPVPALSVVPALRGELYNSRYPGTADPTGDGSLTPQATDDLYATPSLGIKWEAVAGLFLRANGGRYVRPPTMGELFGYAGPISGNPDLTEEVGVNGDAGVTYLLENRGPISRFRLDVGWFGSWMRDLIVYEQQTRDEVRPENIDKAVIQGAETALRLQLSRFLGLFANYTYLLGVNRSDTPYLKGKRLPGRPAHEAYARIEAGEPSGMVGSLVWLDADFAGHTHLTQANQDAYTVPLRVLLGCGCKLTHARSGLGITVEVKNVLNRLTFPNLLGDEAPVSDFVNFPLPGRTVLVTLFWRN